MKNINMKFYTPILFALLSLSVFSQDSLKTKRFSIGFIFSPDFCNAIKYEGKNSGTLNGKTDFNFLVSGGFSFNWFFAKNYSLETDILFSQKGQKVAANTFTWVSPQIYDPTIPNYATSSSTSTNRHRNYYNYHYWEVPVKLNRYFFKKRFKLLTSVGVSANVFLGKKSIYINEGFKDKYRVSRDYNSNNIPEVDMALLVGVGITYDISKRVYLKLEPSYRQFIRAMVDEPINGYLYSLGLNSGINIRF